MPQMLARDGAGLGQFEAENQKRNPGLLQGQQEAHPLKLGTAAESRFRLSISLQDAAS